MSTKTKVTEVPFTAAGSLMHFPKDRLDYSEAEWGETSRTWTKMPAVVTPDWRPNVPFTATLRLDSTRRGRSAAYFVWLDGDGREFPMFLTDLADLIKSGNVIAGGVIAGLWMVAKRGQNYGVRLATDGEIPAADPGTTDSMGTWT